VGKKKERTVFFNQWQWWVRKTMELGPAPPFFKQIHGGAAGAGCVWQTIFWSGVGFLDLELRGALPNTPLIST
jgi:hypothetical protein